ncbi:MAG: hypothetical protein IPP40_14845 [bacterium]|nr:hypothetical protein [bacterium]
MIEGRDNDELFLAYQQRDGCGTGLGLNLVRLSDEGEILAQESVGTPGMTVLRGMDLPDIGNFFVAAVSNWGRRDKTFYGGCEVQFEIDEDLGRGYWLLTCQTAAVGPCALTRSFNFFVLA